MQNQHMQNQHMQNQHMQNQHMQNQHIPNYVQYHNPNIQNNRNKNIIKNEDYEIEHYENKEKNYCSCVSVSDHVFNCKVCTKLYNNDRTIYIITIVMLSIICILLLKKVLNI
jgi:hypothetical protein